MKDMPVFTTEYGVASLVLREIPYQKNAYVTVRSSLEPGQLIRECVSFCRMCGAEQVYATGHEYLCTFPLHTVLVEMSCLRAQLEDTDAALWPVQEENLEEWRRIYNRKVVNVPNGAWMTQKDGAEMLAKGNGYFVHRGEVLLGIGRASGDAIDWVASTAPGAGGDVVRALAHALTEERLKLIAAENNEKAIRLYESLGFLKTREVSRWYSVL